MSSLVVFVNGASGRGHATQLLARLRRREAMPRDAVVVAAPSAEAARAELADALSPAVERVIVFGGDGTVHLVANTILTLGLGSRVTLGLVPAGTGCDFARSLGVPRRAERAFARALGGPPLAVDALRVEIDGQPPRRALNVASAGVSGLVDQAVNALPRRGTISYLGATLRALRRYRNVPCRVTVDGEAWHDGPMLLLAVANGRTFGKGMRIAPHALLTDGLAEVVLVGAVPRAELLVRLPQVYLGTHLRARYVRYARARTVLLEPRGDLPPLDLDGETARPGVTRLTIEPGAVRFAGPPAAQ